ncbi:maleylacetoacetate isomerase [Sulfitobacter sp. M57]|jgi:maleylpyruvate isomerase|uniref:maleylacetoacetate isomerase n=1 Tax=unclassified Sulfitobacter TaxID=196795 RepID=UPI0023E1DA3E|nr:MULTISPECIES: maleylacetoacetate isomerase [unclassified Sulfitobacter]MDF3416317.1 maleylacetoacetate isomerase [Sulfitobacter sp. KE5]MDF3423796.1 maleylacetoacetate isomerase [Sulfitobacter sp. KE43]MDF3434863.1 maleylacetoacetate isomerase [Sulfitobacter sp. KE42]MDF3460502.1 maleylacetoacetate isomerase [Sulfitobacter sp. S74]MDF3464400.1 maleylacetoacetate isomerase [Sulfitobacter sp. Ks18]
MTLRLHNFFRSSTSTRLRAALNVKGLEYDYIAYVLRDGETRTPSYLSRNPQGLVPTLELEDGTNLTQSLAIIEYLEEICPAPTLLPTDPLGRARVRALSYMIACEIHPLNNLRVLFRLRDQFDADETAQKDWFTHWVETTFDALEAALQSPETGRFCHGNTPGLADVCLYAQVWNNKRFGIPLEKWPTIARIFAELHGMPEFANAAPPNQPDAA